VRQVVLSGKDLPGQPVPAGSRATDEKSGANFIQRFLRDDVLEAVQRLKPIADQAGLSMPQLAIAWVLQNPNVAAALVGASRPEQLAQTVKASGVTLDADTLAAIDTALGDAVTSDPEHTYSTSPKTRLV
jgi:aryl-alcohol dehydrogenase-like predicted oxidoreductase